MCFMLLTGSYGSMTVCKIPKKFCAKRFQPATFDHQESRLDVIDPLFLHLLPPPWIHLKFPHRCSLVTGCKPKITTIASGNHRWLPLFFPHLHPFTSRWNFPAVDGDSPASAKMRRDVARPMWSGRLKQLPVVAIFEYGIRGSTSNTSLFYMCKDNLYM
jgi:hypothetical protein